MSGSRENTGTEACPLSRTRSALTRLIQPVTRSLSPAFNIMSTFTLFPATSGAAYPHPAPSRAAHDPSDFLAQLRQNESENRAMFASAGISSQAVKVIRCRECGISDNAIFWSFRGSRRGRMLLRCPTCEGYTYKYPLQPQATGRFPRLTGLARHAELVVGLLTIGLPLYLFAAPLARDLVADLTVQEAEAYSAPATEVARGSEPIQPVPSNTPPAVRP